MLELGIENIQLDTADSSWISDLQQINPCYVFIALHGGDGENGAVQGVLDSLGLEYSGSGVAGSAIAMNKHLAKAIWQQHGLPTLPSILISTLDDKTLAVIKENFTAPYCMKVIDQGSSIGVRKVNSFTDLNSTYNELSKISNSIMLEQWVEGREFFVGILQQQALPAVEVVTSRDFYDYVAKYNSNDTQYICPCDLTPQQQERLSCIAKQAFESIQCSHWGRIDFIADKNMNFYLIEANTIPGMSTKSLFPMAASQLGYSFTDLILAILPKEIRALAKVRVP